MADIGFFDGNAEMDAICSVGFYSWSVPENRVYGDEVIADIFCVPLDDLVEGAPIELVIRYIDEGDKQRVAKAIHDAIITGLPYQAEYRLTHPDGRKISVTANGRCLRDVEGVPSIYSGTVTLRSSLNPSEGDPLESHCRAALRIATRRRHTLAARYLSSALNVIGGKKEF
ncbi:PAS domain-containing protein [Neorhizobium alkalisoli]|uniref:PAS domain-containing protein n=1 Tax=Neorhizobium alkalisoli TaxID=528178 RepID=UPI000CF8756A|nr:PAS domain-containing protein [Neorhizobium alkalisoli]